MADHPQLFSGAMVCALIRGRKTQTRRILTPHNTLFNGRGWTKLQKAQKWDWAKAWVDQGPSPAGNPGPYLKLPWVSGNNDGFEGTVHRIYPRVQPGDRLWVKETFAHVGGGDPGYLLCAADWRERVRELQLQNADEPPRWRPSIFMPRHVSRITLPIEQVRIQRLHEITDEDAIAEGIACVTKDGKLCKFGVADLDGLPGNDNFGWRWQDWALSPRAAYRRLWIMINGEASWLANPWVLAYTFRVAMANIDALGARAA